MFIKMKINTPEFQKVITPEVKELWDIFRRHNYEIRMAGGAVRDILMHKCPEDIDFATTATPDQMKMMFNDEGVRMINTKGEKHGTVTVRIHNKMNFEVTTLRIDVVTDGRHAEVQFTDNWELDANRRDLTINSMFLGLDGTVYDYMNGIQDLEMRRVKFVGDSSQRIQEDYLRILRYFRFYGRIAVEPNSHDAEVLNAIRENVDGLSKIAGERLWVELKKILMGNYADSLAEVMVQLGVFPYLGLPKINLKRFQTVWSRSHHIEPKISTLLAALLESKDDIMIAHHRIKFSNEERHLCSFILQHLDISPSENNLKPFKDLVLDTNCSLQDVCELLKYHGEKELFEQLSSWSVPKFPLNGHMLIQHGVEKGPRVGELLAELKIIWMKSDCTSTAQELLQNVKQT